MTLLDFSRDGNLEKVKELIENGVNINQTDNNGATSLIIALYYNHLKIAELLLKTGADVNQSTSGFTPLCIALFKGYINIVKLLIEADANVNKTAKFLLKHGANANQIEDDLVPLMIAAFKGHTDSVRLLLEAGANVNQPMNRGETSLYLAVQEGHTDIIKTLLKHGAKINVYVQSDIGYLTPYNIANDKIKIIFLTFANKRKIVLDTRTPLKIEQDLEVKRLEYRRIIPQEVSKLISEYLYSSIFP